MEITGVDKIEMIWTRSGERIAVRHPVKMIINKASEEAGVRHYVCRNGTNVVVRDSWDVCILTPAILVEQKVCDKPADGETSE